MRERVAENVHVFTSELYAQVNAGVVVGPEWSVVIDTLAYQHTQQAPKTLKCRDNVIVRLCANGVDMLKPITAVANKAFCDHVLAWAGVSRNLRIWEYAVTYNQDGSVNGIPLPTAHTYGPDCRFYAAHSVEGVFIEMESPVLTDLRDFKVWMVMKTLENPEADYDQRTDTFMDGHYGPAGKAVKAMGRNPKEADVLTRTMLVGQAVTESTAIYSLVVALLLLFVM